MEIDKDDLLSSLETVEAGLSKTEVMEQSSCFIFRKGRLITFNGEMFCMTASPVSEFFTGAVQASPLLNILRVLPDKKVRLENGEGVLAVIGKGRRVRIKIEKKILLPLDKIEKPETWKMLPPDFSEAVKLVGTCVSKDNSTMQLTCVHIHPKYMEATDTDQVIRYKIKTGVSQPVLIRGDHLNKIIPFDVTHFAETNSWMFFKNSTGMKIACLRWAEEFIDLAPFLEMKEGNSLSLHKGLIKAAKAAEVFSRENKDDNMIRVLIQGDKIKVEAEGLSGGYEEFKKKTNYKGPPLSFLISPTLLQEIVKSYNECLIAKNKLKVSDGRKFDYSACLSVDK